MLPPQAVPAFARGNAVRAWATPALILIVCAPCPSPAATTAPPPLATVNCTDIRTGGEFDFVARHLLGSGTLDTAWVPDPDRLCLGTSDGLHALLRKDGEGGAYAAWVDDRSGDGDIALQRFSAPGTIASGWPGHGLPVCTAPHSQYNLDLAADGVGGAYLAWQDFRSGRASRIYAQRITGAGEVAPGWAAGGQPVADGQGEQAEPHVVSDAQGGALVVWQDRRSGSLELYAQRLGGDGRFAPGWPAAGVRLTHAAGGAGAAALVADSSGQVTMAWREPATTGSGPARVQALRFAAGTVPGPEFPGTAITLGEGLDEAGAPACVVGAGGSALIAWSQWRGGIGSVRAARLLGTGTLAAGWPAGGAEVAATPPGRNAPALLAAPDGGVLLAWEDFRDSTSDLYAQRLDAAGARATGWPANGVAVVSAPGEQYAPTLTRDDSSGALVTWADDSSSPRAGIVAASETGGEVRAVVREATARPGRAHIVWGVTGPLPGTLQAARRVGEAGPLQTIAHLAPGDSGRVVLDDRTAPEGASVSYRLVLVGEGFVRYFAPVTLAIPGAPVRLALRGVRALPASDAIAVLLALPRGAPPVLALYDVMGRRLEHQVFEGLEPGEQVLSLPVPRRLASGIYFLRVSQGAEGRNARVVWIR